MRHRIWLLALVVSMGLACAKDEKVSDTSSTSEKVSQASPAAQATMTPTSNYNVKVTFEGLVGYVKTSSNVWALLPKADPACQPPHYADTSDSNVYPQHFAALKVPRKNVQGSTLTNDLYQIPLDGYDLVLEGVTTGTGPALDATNFHQLSSDGVRDPTVDKLKTGMLAVPPAQPDLLAARMILPSLGFEAKVDTGTFQIVEPVLRGGGSTICDNTTTPNTNPVATRVETVVWTSPTLSAPITLTLRPFRGAASSLVLEPAGESTIEIKVVNQVVRSFLDPNHRGAHWAAYRWFYNLSNSGTDCTKHYYPNGLLGGNRCPQKLYTE